MSPAGATETGRIVILTADDVRQALPMAEAVAACEKAYASFSAGEARVPLRTQLPIEEHQGVSVFMPAYMPPAAASGLKVVSVYPRNPEKGLPTIMGMVALLDPQTGAPLALLEGGYLTALRTGAAAGVAARYLAREDASVAALFGAGIQGRTQVLALACVRSLKEVRVADPVPGRPEQFIADLSSRLPQVRWRTCRPEEAVLGADVVITATTSRTPVFPGEMLAPGTHVNAIGAFTPEMRELDTTAVTRAHKIVVDSREAAWAEAGDLIIPWRQGDITQERIYAEIGEIVSGKLPGRQNDDEITIYKAVGISALDMATAAAAYQRALTLGIGTLVPFP